MKEVEHGDRGSECNEDDRRQIEGDAEDDQQDSGTYGPQDRMDENPVTETARKTAHRYSSPADWSAPFSRAITCASMYLPRLNP